MSRFRVKISNNKGRIGIDLCLQALWAPAQLFANVLSDASPAAADLRQKRFFARCAAALACFSFATGLYVLRDVYYGNFAFVGNILFVTLTSLSLLIFSAKFISLYLSARLAALTPSSASAIQNPHAYIEIYCLFCSVPFLFFAGCALFVKLALLPAFALFAMLGLLAFELWSLSLFVQWLAQLYHIELRAAWRHIARSIAFLFIGLPFIYILAVILLFNIFKSAIT